jgi:hypothetical protein
MCRVAGRRWPQKPKNVPRRGVVAGAHVARLRVVEDRRDRAERPARRLGMRRLRRCQRLAHVGGGHDGYRQIEQRSRMIAGEEHDVGGAGARLEFVGVLIDAHAEGGRVDLFLPGLMTAKSNRIFPFRHQRLKGARLLARVLQADCRVRTDPAFVRAFGQRRHIAEDEPPGAAFVDHEVEPRRAGHLRSADFGALHRTVGEHDPCFFTSHCSAPVRIRITRLIAHGCGFRATPLRRCGTLFAEFFSIGSMGYPGRTTPCGTP